jgi:hypothetical protein
MRWRLADESSEGVPAAFSGGGEGGAEAGEAGGAFEGAQATGDFHLHLHHAQILLGQIIGEAVKEAQDVVLVALQPLEQVVTGTAFRPSRRALFEGPA